MKKSILALAVAAALTAPLAAQADTILYGSARVSVDYNDEGSTDPFDNDNGVWDVTNLSLIHICGRTTGSDSVNLGSNPSPPATPKTHLSSVRWVF